MLRSLEISRFKSIRQQRLDLGRVNLFIGGNGTGKSNILEAIGLASACLDRGLGDSDIGRKGMRITPPELMKSSFKNDELPKTLELCAEFDGDVSYRCQLQSSPRDPLLRIFSESSFVGEEKIFGRSQRGASATGVSHADRLDASRGIWDQIKATYEIPEHAQKAFSEFSRYVIYSPQTDFLRGRQLGKIDVPPVGLHGEGLTQAASSILKYAAEARRGASERLKRRLQLLTICLNLIWLPKWAKTFGVAQGSQLITSTDLAGRDSKSVYFLDRYMHARRNKLSVYDSSEGTLFLLFVAIVLSHPEAPKIFALDNVDNSLNPKLTRSLIETIIKVCEENWDEVGGFGAKQVFMTSHNPTALDAFDIFNHDQRVFVVRRDERGHTVVDRMVPPDGFDREQWALAKGGRNLSQLWLDGDIPGALGGGDV